MAAHTIQQVATDNHTNASLSLTSESRLMLHVFTDASSYAYGTVVYVKFSRTAYRSLVIPKSRIMPKASEKKDYSEKELITKGEGMHISVIAMKP